MKNGNFSFIVKPTHWRTPFQGRLKIMGKWYKLSRNLYPASRKKVPYFVLLFSFWPEKGTVLWPRLFRVKN